VAGALDLSLLDLTLGAARRLGEKSSGADTPANVQSAFVLAACAARPMSPSPTQDVVEEPVLLGLGRREHTVVVGVRAESVHALPGVLREDLLNVRADPHHLVRLQDQFGDGSLALRGSLVQDDPCVRSAVCLPGAPAASNMAPTPTA